MRRKCNPAEISKLEGLVANINACDTSKCEVYVCPSPLPFESSLAPDFLALFANAQYPDD